MLCRWCSVAVCAVLMRCMLVMFAILSFTPCLCLPLYCRHGGMQCARAPEGRSTQRPNAPVVADAELSCGALGGVISSIDFASWGHPDGDCGAFFAYPECHAVNSVSAIEALCVGKASCAIPTHADFWEASAGDMSGCANLTSSRRAAAVSASQYKDAVTSRYGDAVVVDSYDAAPVGTDPRVLVVQATCSLPHALTVSVELPVGTSADVALPLYGRALTGVNKAAVSGDVSGAGVHKVTNKGDAVVVSVSSGAFAFTLA